MSETGFIDPDIMRKPMVRNPRKAQREVVVNATKVGLQVSGCSVQKHHGDPTQFHDWFFIWLHQKDLRKALLTAE